MLVGEGRVVPSVGDEGDSQAEKGADEDVLERRARNRRGERERSDRKMGGGRGMKGMKTNLPVVSVVHCEIEGRARRRESQRMRTRRVVKALGTNSSVRQRPSRHQAEEGGRAMRETCDLG